MSEPDKEPSDTPKSKGGRPKGSPNKATANAREAIARFIDGNSERLQEWLDQIELEDGAQAAVRCFIDLIEFHVPKLARTEHTGPGGGAIEVKLASGDEKL